jgi:hypothetical protein
MKPTDSTARKRVLRFIVSGALVATAPLTAGMSCGSPQPEHQQPPTPNTPAPDPEPVVPQNPGPEEELPPPSATPGGEMNEGTPGPAATS